MPKLLKEPATRTTAYVVREGLQLSREEFSIAMRCALTSVYRWEKQNPSGFYGELLEWMAVTLKDKSRDGAAWGQSILEASQAIDSAETQLTTAAGRGSARRVAHPIAQPLLDRWRVRNPSVPDLSVWMIRLMMPPGSIDGLPKRRRRRRRTPRESREATRALLEQLRAERAARTKSST